MSRPPRWYFQHRRLEPLPLELLAVGGERPAIIARSV
jgi:hypothetical protein